MTTYLIITTRRDAESWPIETEEDLDSAIAELAYQIACDAGSDELEEGTDECRAEYERQIIADATHALVYPGDTYRSPDRDTYELVEREL